MLSELVLAVLSRLLVNSCSFPLEADQDRHQRKHLPNVSVEDAASNQIYPTCCAMYMGACVADDITTATAYTHDRQIGRAHV